MQIVIDIPRQIYESVVNTGKFGCYQFDTRKAIKNGTPLPEHHGRLIDADDLKAHKYHDNKAYENAVAVYWIDNAPTVLKEVKE